MSGYSREFFEDSDVVIKQEPNISENNNIAVSASVPIPARRINPVYRDIGFEQERSQSPSIQEINLLENINSDNVDENTMWGAQLGADTIKTDPLMNVDDDDIFQVDKSDLIQGPTLAELNANDDALFGDLNFDDLLLPEENNFSYISSETPISNGTILKYSTPLSFSSQLNNNSHTLLASSYPQFGASTFKESPNDLPNSLGNNFHDALNKSNIMSLASTQFNFVKEIKPSHAKSSALQDLLTKDEYDKSQENLILTKFIDPCCSAGNHSYPLPRTHLSRLSSSAPSQTHLGFEQIWQRREPRKHLLSTGSLAEAGSTSSLSTGGVLSPEPLDFSHDDLESDDSDHYEDFSSENGK